MPSEASSENQVDRYSAIPCWVVYQETIDSRQLATNKAWTIGRVTPTEDAIDLGSMNRQRLDRPKSSLAPESKSEETYARARPRMAIQRLWLPAGRSAAVEVFSGGCAAQR